MPQLNGGGGDDLGANDELISFKDEGEQEEKISENSSAERDLADVKSSLVNESETNQNSSSDSEVRGSPGAAGGRGPRCARGRSRSRRRPTLSAAPTCNHAFCFVLFVSPSTSSPHLSLLFRLSFLLFSLLPPPTPQKTSPPRRHPLPRLPRADARLAPRRSGGPRLGPKLSEINPGKV